MIVDRELIVTVGDFLRRTVAGSYCLHPLEALAKGLGVGRATAFRYVNNRAPRWLVFALLGVVLSRGDRDRAGRLLEASLVEGRMELDRAG